jgi:hypothetical protein
MQRLFIFTFLVLFSSCWDDDVFVFEGRAENNYEYHGTARQMSADYSVQFTIVDEKVVHCIVTLKNRKYSDAGGESGTLYLSIKSKCYDKHGNVLFELSDSKTTERSDGVWKGVLNKVTAETVRKVSKVEIELTNSISFSIHNRVPFPLPPRKRDIRDVEQKKLDLLNL